MGFRYDLRHLSPQRQQIIKSKDESTRFIREDEERRRKSEQRVDYPISIFMKLGYNPSTQLNGVETINMCETFCSDHGSVWLSTDALSSGMSEKRRAEFINAIRKSHIVGIFFAVGKGGGGDNDIQYRGEIIDIKSSNSGSSSPDKELTPDAWKDSKNKIWLQLRKLIPCSQLSANDFIVATTGNVLAKAIEK